MTSEEEKLFAEFVAYANRRVKECSKQLCIICGRQDPKTMTNMVKYAELLGYKKEAERMQNWLIKLLEQITIKTGEKKKCEN